MIEPRTPIYQWGQKVCTETDLYNDGTYPDREPEALLVAAGSEGEIVQVGFHEEANIPVYLVEFANGCVVGCFEEELRSEQGSAPVAGVL
ncbi:nitrogen fixation protein NifZ [Methylocaldum sp.]|uniref:nitrogen fixation protein NifZ n=1 Tax=Methylocaldum sp. TaxID=1969727 RepID=UPI002D6B2BB1|nr:nitrogen fixation protein NifZ [Methylocaldum sp.]HYE37567.1 nitrogen fixation protein NifZ [Methylocaldum sp.]